MKVITKHLFNFKNDDTGSITINELLGEFS